MAWEEGFSCFSWRSGVQQIQTLRHRHPESIPEVGISYRWVCDGAGSDGVVERWPKGAAQQLGSHTGSGREVWGSSTAHKDQ